MPVIFRYKGFRFFFYSNEGNPREPGMFMCGVVMARKPNFGSNRKFDLLITTALMREHCGN
jgi:hypothetical protein